MSTVRSFLYVMTAVAITTPALSAQTPTRSERSRVIINGRELGPTEIQELVRTRRARLGVTVDLQAQANDSVGATISAVTPGGPAFKAGIQSGDVITKLDGKSVLTGPTPADAGPEQSVPGLRLIEIASALNPDATVAVEFKRGSQRRTVSLVTGNELIGFGFTLDGPRELFFSPESLPGGIFGFGFSNPGNTFRFEEGPPSGRVIVRSSSRFTNLELAPLNPDLGAYFGSAEGVLVVRVDERSELGLKGGDIILSIDGRQVSTPSDAMRILRSYVAGESIRLEILRNRQRQTISSKIGGQE